jgi:phage terminase large subunit-like protein
VDGEPLKNQYAALKRKHDLLEHKIKLQKGLPHLYRWKNYAWADKFLKSTNKINLICAANQISKSSSQIRKAIDWATNRAIWPKLWKGEPLQFWYLYPTKDVASIEFEKKWVPEFLPAGEYKDSPQYGWKEEWKGGHIQAIHFNTGVSIYFKAYAQDVQHLQTGTVHYVACDEEMPENLFDELMLRLAATDGYFSMVFTATLGQEFWRKAIEGRGEEESFPTAFKQQVSMYDCLAYMDGTPGAFTDEKISRIKSLCRSEVEVQRRVYGKFVADTGLIYETFDRKRHYLKGHPVPRDWHIYAGVDPGGGGESAHPAAIAFVACDSVYKQLRVVECWRGDKQLTTAGDVLSKYIELRNARGFRVTQAFFDWAAKDFGTIATRMGEPFIPAEKSHEIGEAALNVLFRHDMLKVYESSEAEKLVVEFSTLRHGMPKRRRLDDLSDAVRYAVSKITIDWNAITPLTAQVEERIPTEADLRRQAFEAVGVSEEEISREFKEWNEAYGN